MSKKQTKAATGGRVRVKLLTHHTHAGEEKAPGDVIEVSAAAAQALVGWGVGEVLTQAAAASHPEPTPHA
jgi:hypothetical protein